MLGSESFDQQLRNTDPVYQGLVTDNCVFDNAELLARERLQQNKSGYAIQWYPNSAPADKETMAILMYELLFARKAKSAASMGLPSDRLSPLEGTIIDAGNQRVFSSLNGAGVTGPLYYYGKPLNQEGYNKLPDKVKMALIRSHFRIVGVSKFEVDMSKGGFMEQIQKPEISVAIGGLTKTINTGLKPLNIGDLVVWNVRSTDERLKNMYPPQSMPLIESTGTPKGKLLFCTEPLNYADLVSHTSVCEIVRSTEWAPTTIRATGPHQNVLTEIDYSTYEHEKGFYIIDSFVNDYAKNAIHIAAVGAAFKNGEFDIDEYIATINRMTDENFTKNHLKSFLSHVLGPGSDPNKHDQYTQDARNVADKLKKLRNKNASFLYSAGAMCLFSGAGKVEGEVYDRVFCKTLRSAASGQAFDLVQQNTYRN